MYLVFGADNFCKCAKRDDLHEGGDGAILEVLKMVLSGYMDMVGHLGHLVQGKRVVQPNESEVIDRVRKTRAEVEGAQPGVTGATPTKKTKEMDERT